MRFQNKSKIAKTALTHNPMAKEWAIQEIAHSLGKEIISQFPPVETTSDQFGELTLTTEVFSYNREQVERMITLIKIMKPVPGHEIPPILDFSVKLKELYDLITK